MNAMNTNSKADNLNPNLTPQRRHPRVPFQVEITVESDHNFYTGFTQNISEGGLFIATPKLLPVGTKIAFTFRVDATTEPVSVYGVVRWLRESSRLTEDAPPGMGVQFSDLPPAIEDRINQFIRRQRDTIFYDD